MFRWFYVVCLDVQKPNASHIRGSQRETSQNEDDLFCRTRPTSVPSYVGAELWEAPFCISNFVKLIYLFSQKPSNPQPLLCAKERIQDNQTALPWVLSILLGNKQAQKTEISYSISHHSHNTRKQTGLALVN